MAFPRITNVKFGNSQLNYIYSINYLIKYQIEHYLKDLCKYIYIYTPKTCIKRVPNQKHSKKTNIIFLKPFGYEMFRDVKIQNILDLIKVSKCIQSS
jgi:hypothetical protein